MIEAKRTLDNEFQHSDNKNKSNKKDFSENPNSPILKTGISPSYSLEDTINLKRKIEFITQYLKPYVLKILYEVLKINPGNIKIICDYIVAEQNEINIKESTKETKIKKLVHLSKYFYHKKTFYEMTKEDLLDYLNSLRKPSSLDPTHKSIGTWNSRQMLFLKFFRWLYNPNRTRLEKKRNSGLYERHKTTSKKGKITI